MGTWAVIYNPNYESVKYVVRPEAGGSVKRYDIEEIIASGLTYTEAHEQARKLNGL
jgi:hypothetical protein